MRKGLSKFASALAGLIALIGINAGNVQASTTQQQSDKTPLVLEHGAVYHWTDGGTHWSHGSHGSHGSHSSHYSGR